MSYDNAVTLLHAVMVASLLKPAEHIIEEFNAFKANLIHSAIGISGESGELLDAVKKHVIYNKPLDRENVIEELGDLEFYMEALRSLIDITREETLEANIKKLGKRYSEKKYSDQQAINRADKD